MLGGSRTFLCTPAPFVLPFARCVLVPSQMLLSSSLVPPGAHMAGRWAAPQQSLVSAQSMKRTSCLSCHDRPLGTQGLILFCICPSLAEEIAAPTSALPCSAV